MNIEEKNIAEMLHVYVGDISDQEQLETCLTHFGIGQDIKIDTIVNAANPTLMGSDQGVDGAIHKAIDKLQGLDGMFDILICKEIDGLPDTVHEEDIIHERIRCPRGKAVITKGYKLCNYVVHTVGAKYDGAKPQRGTAYKKQRKVFKTCSSSRVKTLTSCYKEIINVIKNHPDIKNVAIPIVGAGKYEFPFEMAVKIAIGGIGNALIDWKQKDPEAFSDKTKGLQNIVFFVYPDECGEGNLAKEVLKEYKEIYQQDDQAVMFNSFQSQIQYIYEIKRYDIQRGYFFIARSLRILLAYIRLISIWTYFKDLYGKRNWQKRRLAVEYTTVFKMFFPFISWVLIRHCLLFQGHVQETVLYGIICYNLMDTITYLVVLIVMADIQNPSANIIRSMILLAFNYLEMAFAVAYFYYLYYRGGGMDYCEALKIGLLGGEASEVKMDTIYEYLLLYANAGLKFFFVTLVFGYFVGHMRQRKFRA